MLNMISEIRMSSWTGKRDWVWILLPTNMKFGFHDCGYFQYLQLKVEYIKMFNIVDCHCENNVMKKSVFKVKSVGKVETYGY